MRAITAFILLISFLPAWGSDEAREHLLRARSLKCIFGPGTIADWEKGNPKLESANIGKTANGGADITNYDAIDIKNGRARMITSVGTADLSVTVGTYGLTFTENFLAGVSIATVFSEYKSGTREFIAVLSRHVDLAGLPFPSQYHGTCNVLQ